MWSSAHGPNFRIIFQTSLSIEMYLPGNSYTYKPDICSMEFSKGKLLIAILDEVLREFTNCNEIGDDSGTDYLHQED